MPPPAHRTVPRQAAPRRSCRKRQTAPRRASISRTGDELSAAPGSPARPAAGLAGLAGTAPPAGLVADRLAVLVPGLLSEVALPGAGLRAVAAVERLPDLPAVCRVAITCSSSL